jgi:hypothetical protein
LNQVGANVQNFQDTNVSASTSYAYTIKAYRGSIESDTSNTTNVTTPACGSCYTLTTTISPSNGGTVTPNPAPNCSSTQYTSGTHVTLTAASNTSYAFQSWSGCDSSVGGTCNVTMNSARGVTASFAATSVAISSVVPAAPYCVCRNASTLYDRVLWVTGQNLRATYHLQFLKVTTSETSIHFNQEVTWQDTAHASVDIARIKSMLWSDSKLTLQVRITDPTYSPLSGWSAQFTLADNVTTCGAAQPRQSNFLPMINGR